MLRPQQVRQIVILGVMLLMAVALITLYPTLIRARNSAFRTASNPPPPSLEGPPAPPSSPLPPGAVILHGALKDVKDFTPLEAVESEPAYRKLVEHVASLSEEALPSSSEGEIAYATYLSYAPELRGRIFRVRGEAMKKIEAVRLADPIAGREDVYRVFIWDEGLESGFVCDLVDRPVTDLSLRDPVQIEGMFYKVVRYLNRKNQLRDVPLLVARSFGVPPPAVATPRHGGSPLLVLAVTVGIAATLLIAFFLMRGMIRPNRKSSGRLHGPMA